MRLYRLPSLVEVPNALRGRLPAVDRVVGLDPESDFLFVRTAVKEVLALEPFRETGYQLLMRAHAGAGNPAEALRVYERCRALLAEELGVSPSPATESLHLDILRAG